MNERLKEIVDDLRHIAIFPARYETPGRNDSDYWRGLMRKYGNAEKRIQSSGFSWYVLEYRDGRQELVHLRVLRNGLFSGKAPAIYRGMLFPRMIDLATFSHIENIRLAF